MNSLDGPSPVRHCWDKTSKPRLGKQQALTPFESLEQDKTSVGQESSGTAKTTSFLRRAETTGMTAKAAKVAIGCNFIVGINTMFHNSSFCLEEGGNREKCRRKGNFDGNTV